MSHAKQLHHRRYLDDYLTIMNRAGRKHGHDPLYTGGEFRRLA